MTHELDKTRGRLAKLVRSAEPMNPRLPLVHSSDAFLLADVLENGTLQPQACPVFEGEALTYFFYGRPAFRPNAREEATALQHYFPICLIFKPQMGPAIRRVFPFDSGAYQGGLYNAYLHRRMNLGDFALDADPASPGRLVTRFYGSNAAYMYSADPISTGLEADDFEAHAYVGLAGAKGGNAVDSRGSGVEVQSDGALDLRGGLDAVILPIAFLNTRMGVALRELGAKLLPYHPAGRTSPSELYGAVFDVCVRYYVESNLIEPGAA